MTRSKPDLRDHDRVIAVDRLERPRTAARAGEAKHLGNGGQAEQYLRADRAVAEQLPRRMDLAPTVLQQIETLDGLTILASYLDDNLNDAFARRFESVVYFPVPRPAERLRLWTRGFSNKASFAPDVAPDALARDHELAGGSIMNVIRRVSLTAIAEGSRPITRDDLLQGIRRELTKEGRAG